MSNSDGERAPVRAGARGRLVDVAVNSGQPARQAFTYEVADELDVRTGQAVFVPYGARVLQGIVLRDTPAPPESVDDVRAIASVADPDPVLDATHVALAEWISSAYLAPLWDSVAVCLPSGYGQRPVTMVSPVDVPPVYPANERDRAILAFLGEHGRVTLDALREGVGQVTLDRLRKLQESGHLAMAQGLARPPGHPRMERRVRLVASPEQARARADVMQQRSPRSVAARVLLALIDEPDVALARVREEGATPGHLEALANECLIETYERRVERGLWHGPAEAGVPATLTSAQQAAVNAIVSETGTYLVHGVTGSGKTEVYLELVQRALHAGNGAIVLVPEIALTPQAVQRYGALFGDTLAVFHSSLGTGDLYDQWYRVQRGDARLVIGSRSALFAPVQSLGLVVIDEEHEWTYKQVDPQPRYHARAAAEELCLLSGATLVLGSATPDIVTYHRSEHGQVRRVELPERVSPEAGGGAQAAPMPHISVVDMREELKDGNRSVFSRPLAEAVRGALGAGEQAILFVNRRGSARFMLCRDCGYLPLCPSCELAMGLDTTEPLHAALVCHHCGRTRRLEDRCPQCDGTRYRPFGAGTQRIEQEARRVFAGARVARWDSDTTGRKGQHETMLQRLEAREIDLLVGTQMLAKGLDLPAMSVVGVVDADVGLSIPDYTAHERTFQLLSQVAGRAGRRGAAGRVFIQTYEPDAAPIVAAADHDYRAFFEHEIAHRRRAGYPPFARLVKLMCHHPDDERALEEASRVATEMRVLRDAAGQPDPDVLGPSRAYVRRRRGEYRWQLLLRGRDPVRLLSQIRLGSRWVVDVDPAGTL